MITNPNFSHSFSSSLQNIMEMGFYNNVVNQGIVGSYPSSSSNNNNNNTIIANVNQNVYPLDALLQKHNNEVDHYLHIQGERLKEAINQQKRQQMQLLAKWYESKSMALLKEKEENLEKLRVKSQLLEEYLKKAEQESEVWQNLAKENQQMVIGLNNMLILAQQNIISNNNNNHNHFDNDNVNVNVVNGGNENNDAESVSDCESSNDNNMRRVNEDKKREEMKEKISCKWCKNETRNVVLLPCKHLCCCKSCEPFLGLCPICHCVKQGSIEVFLS